MYRRLFLGPLIASLGLLLALVVVEITFRIISNFRSQIYWSDRPQTFYFPKDAVSKQDFPYQVQKPANTFRIAVVGDSFTFAPYLQFDDAFPKRLERLLNLNSQLPHVEVINYGVPRYSTTHEVEVVRKALAEQADLILLQITLNDPEMKPYWPTELKPDRDGKLDAKGGIYEYWKSLSFVVTRIRNKQSVEDYKNYFFELFKDGPPLNQFSRSLRKIKEQCDAAGKPLAAIVFPLFGVVVNESYPFWPIHQKVGALLDELKISYSDITESFRGIPVERLQVIPVKDRHPNEIGHRIAAEAILGWLQRVHVIPDSAVPVRVSDQRLGVGFKEN